MLDQPVPNPLAKNPNVHTHKVFASVGLILIGVIVILGVLGFIYRDMVADIYEDLTGSATTTESTKVSTSSASKSETEDWKSYTNSTVGYTIKYPSNWLYADSMTGKNCINNHVFFAPTQETLGICSSGFGGLIQIIQSTGSTVEQALQEHKTNNPLADYQQSETTVGGHNAIKYSGISQLEDEIVSYKDYKYIAYLVEDGSNVIYINYSQAPTWTDSSAEFEKMVSTFKFL